MLQQNGMLLGDIKRSHNDFVRAADRYFKEFSTLIDTEEQKMNMKQTLKEAVSEYIEKHVSRNENASFSAAFRAGAEWQANQSPWISVEDAVPSENANGICQVKSVDGSIGMISMRKVKYWIYPHIEHGYVTHWRPIVEQ